MAELDLFQAPPTAPADGGLRERATQLGVACLPDHEVLELLLARSLGQGARTWASALLQRWTSLAALLAADTAQLAAVVGPQAALDLKLVHGAAVRIAAEPMRRRCVLSSWTALLAYLKVCLSERTREEFRVVFLDKKNQLIADERLGEGTVDHAPVYPREVLRRALELEASALVLVHNHPSGDPTPSSADIEMTRQVVEAAKALRISVHDHVVVGREGVASLKALGLI